MPKNRADVKRLRFHDGQGHQHIRVARVPARTAGINVMNQNKKSQIKQNSKCFQMGGPTLLFVEYYKFIPFQ